MREKSPMDSTEFGEYAFQLREYLALHYIDRQRSVRVGFHCVLEVIVSIGRFVSIFIVFQVLLIQWIKFFSVIVLIVQFVSGFIVF